MVTPFPGVPPGPRPARLPVARPGTLIGRRNDPSLTLSRAGPARRATKEDDVLSDAATATRHGTAPEAAPRVTGGAPRPQPSVPALLAAILDSLDTDKAEEVVTIDLAGKSQMADHMVVASGRSSRQVQSIAEKLTARLKADFDRIAKVEGKGTGDWVLIDTGDVIVHVFRPEVRDFYQIEKMWGGPGAPGAPAPATDHAAAARPEPQG